MKFSIISLSITEIQAVIMGAMVSKQQQQFQIMGLNPFCITNVYV